MTALIDRFLQKFVARPHVLFLIDGLGAIVSTGLLYVLAHWEPFFGMPPSVLYGLMPIPTVFAVYSLACFAIKPRGWRPALFLIATANLLYCLLTLGLIMYHAAQLTPLGIAYFLGEVGLVASLAAMEIRLAGRA